MTNYHEYIDDYLSGSLSEQDQRDFLQQLESDQKLQDEVQFHQEVLMGIEQFGKEAFVKTLYSVEDELDREGFFSSVEERDIIEGIETLGKSDFGSVIKEVDKELEKENFYSKSKPKEETARIIRMGNRRRLLAIAASIAILTIAAVLFWPRNDLEQVYAANFELMLDPISNELNVEKSEIGFAGTNEPLLNLEAAMNFYNQANCTEFLLNSASLVNETSLAHYQDRLYLLRGICFMHTEQFQLAEESLRLTNHPLAHKYLLLTYIRKENIEKARDLFNSIADPDVEILQLYQEID